MFGMWNFVRTGRNWPFFEVGIRLQQQQEQAKKLGWIRIGRIGRRLCVKKTSMFLLGAPPFWLIQMSSVMFRAPRILVSRTTAAWLDGTWSWFCIDAGFNRNHQIRTLSSVWVIYVYQFWEQALGATCGQLSMSTDSLKKFHEISASGISGGSLCKAVSNNYLQLHYLINNLIIHDSKVESKSCRIFVKECF